jgi:hypothetical protein
MKKYDLLIDFIIATESFDTQNTGICVKSKIALLISDISIAIGKREVYNLKGDEENIAYMDKIIENRLDDEYIYLDEYEKWYEENKDLKIEQDVE